MEQSSASREVNLLGALALAVTDEMQFAIARTGGRGASASSALVALHEFLHGGSINDLRRVLGLTHSGTVRLIDTLVADGFVSRDLAVDGRAVSLTLTQRGRDAAREAARARSDAIGAVLAGLSDPDRASLSTAMETILASITTVRQIERSAQPSSNRSWVCRLCDFAACERDKGGCPVASTAQALRSGQ